MGDISSRLSSVPKRVIFAGVLGAIVFVLAQEIAGYPQNIAEFMGNQITSRGPLPDALALLAGWTIHVIVALTYAALFGLLLLAPGLSGENGPRLLPAGIAAVVVGYLTGVAAPPAISATLGLLTGEGLPDQLAPVRWSVGFPTWNHIGFFVICFLVLAVAPRLQNSANPSAT